MAERKYAHCSSDEALMLQEAIGKHCMVEGENAIIESVEPILNDPNGQWLVTARILPKMTRLKGIAMLDQLQTAFREIAEERGLPITAEASSDSPLAFNVKGISGEEFAELFQEALKRIGAELIDDE